jgi:NAD(P)-dependent dehydrogenase (short-subunit alcohol dehydrogenase family)
MSMQSKIIAITGGASGIGLATAHLLASRGAHISIADVSQENLDRAAQEIHAASKEAEVLALCVDVTKPEQVEKWVQKIMERWGRLDGAANLAGVIGRTITTFKTLTADLR